MTPERDPFARPAGDPFASADEWAPEHLGPPTSYGVPPALAEYERLQGHYRGQENFSGDRSAISSPPLNTYAVLTPIFAVLVPPAGVAVGHLALPQIKRTGQRGWLAAVCGLVIAYLMCGVLIGTALWWLALGDNAKHEASGRPPAAAPAPAPNVVTSVVPAPVRPRTKLELSQATVGTCVELEKRDESADVESDDALDLYRVPCQHRVGVYQVIARVSTDSECTSTYVAAPPDHGFAVCLDRY